VLLSEATDEFRRLSVLLDQGLTNLREQAVAYAQREAEYRRSKAESWLNTPTGETRGQWTAAQREAHVNAETAELRQARDIADGMRTAALEAVRSRRAQLSALQSLLAAERAESEFARTGPRYDT